MDISEYRRKYEAELEQAAQQEISLRDLRESSRRLAPGDVARLAIAAPQDEEDLTAAVGVLHDRDADAPLRSIELQAISSNIDERPELIDTLLELLRDPSVAADERMAILVTLQEISFRMVLFPAKRSDYLATLRSIVEDPDAPLRRRAIAILARERDEYIQRRLIEGLEQRSKALVPPAQAIQFLGYDVHAEYFPLLREIVEHPPSRAAKREAVRLLAADPSSTDLLVSILNDKGESPDVRKISAIALQSVAPSQFEQQARQIVLEDDEDDQLRAVCINALTHFANPAALSEDYELTRRVEQLRAESASRHVKQATAGYMAKYSS
jgi:hypothetical protein